MPEETLDLTSENIEGFWDIFDLEPIFPAKKDIEGHCGHCVPLLPIKYRSKSGGYEEFLSLIESCDGFFGDWEFLYTLNGKRQPCCVRFTTRAMFEMTKRYVQKRKEYPNYVPGTWVDIAEIRKSQET